MAQQKISRKDLLIATMDDRTISKVDIKEIIMEVGQTAPYHRHPCPVAGYVASGTLLFQIEGEPAKTLKQGKAFFEPANKPILHFDNASKTEALKFIAYYLVIDPSISPANSYAVSNGISVENLIQTINYCISQIPLASVTIASYDPLFDTEDRMLSTINELFEVIAKQI